MSDLVNVCMWFVFASLVHIIGIKLRIKFNIQRSTLLSIFLFGFIGCVITRFGMQSFFLDSSLFYTSMLFYGALSFAYLSLTATPTLGDISPSAQIVQLLSESPKTREQLLIFFQKNNVINKRIQDLIDSKCITLKKQKYYVLRRGIMLSKFILKYRSVLRLQDGG